MKAVDLLSLDLNSSEIVGLVGESGCGKSLSAFSILGISPPSSKLTGKIFYKGTDLLSLDDESKRKIRGNKISLIPQDPLSALNPVFTIGEQITEVLEVHKNASQKEAFSKAKIALENVNIPSGSQRLKDYPHQFSGGMKQRALIAMALITEPDILVADEPTTALDVTIQLQILEIMKLIKNKGKGILLITHDLALVSEVCDRVYVMYLGKVVESGSTKEIFINPRHPYTIGLLNSLPDKSKKLLSPIIGQPPSIYSIPEGCAFHTRCPFVFDRCKKEVPELYTVQNNQEHKSRCFLERLQTRDYRL
ncbi:MAG: ABC transporter ATP-binding protein [Candidatus Melainabacteria bacterium]|nr:ABC transporter ATP-binding protein [Candidatus Melainabacteria bacterium]